MPPLKDKIENLLRQKLSVHKIQLIDESDKHRGHPESIKSGGGHFDLLIVADDFEGTPLIKRHRMIYSALEELRAEIHALAIKALAPSESSTD